MSDLACDRCGRSLLAFEDVRYKVVIKVWAAYDPMEISPEDLARPPADREAELQRLIQACEKRSPEELEAEVYKSFAFDLCLRCQKEYLKDPLPRREG